jgi:hypothetical protein
MFLFPGSPCRTPVVDVEGAHLIIDLLFRNRNGRLKALVLLNRLVISSLLPVIPEDDEVVTSRRNSATSVL